MITRYSRPAMREIWSEPNKLAIWLKIELLASKALVKEGVVPQPDYLKLKAGVERCLADTKALVAHVAQAVLFGCAPPGGLVWHVAPHLFCVPSTCVHFGVRSSVPPTLADPSELPWQYVLAQVA